MSERRRPSSPQLVRVALASLAVFAACDAPRAVAVDVEVEVTDTIEGVRYTLRLPPGYAREVVPPPHGPLDHLRIYRGPGGHLAPGITIALRHDWPADLEQLRRQAGGDDRRVEARSDGYIIERIAADRLRVEVAVLRKEGAVHLACSGQAGFTREPLPDVEATHKLLLEICDSLHVAASSSAAGS